TSTSPGPAAPSPGPSPVDAPSPSPPTRTSSSPARTDQGRGRRDCPGGGVAVELTTRAPGAPSGSTGAAPTAGIGASGPRLRVARYIAWATLSDGTGSFAPIR